MRGRRGSACAEARGGRLGGLRRVMVCGMCRMGTIPCAGGARGGDDDGRRFYGQPSPLPCVWPCLREKSRVEMSNSTQALRSETIESSTYRVARAYDPAH